MLLEQHLRRFVEEQVRFVEEEDELGLVEVADLGQVLEQLGEQPEQEGRVEARARHQLVGGEDVDDALLCRRPRAVCIKSSMSSIGSPKKLVAALLLDLQQAALDRADAGGADVAVLGR